MPTKAKVKTSKSLKCDISETSNSGKTCSAGAKPKARTTKAKAKAAQSKSSTFIKATNKSAETIDEKNHDRKHQSKGKKQTKIHSEVEMLVKMLTKKLKTNDRTPVYDNDNQCSDSENDTNESSLSDEDSSSDCSNDFDSHSSNDWSCSNYSTSEDESDSTSDISSISSSTSSSSSTTSSTSSSSSSYCESSDDCICLDSTHEISDDSIVVAKLKKKPSKKYKAPIKPKSNSIRKTTKSKSVIPAVKSKNANNAHMKPVKSKTKSDPKIHNSKQKETKSQHSIKLEVPSTSNASSVHLKQSSKKVTSNGMMCPMKPKIEPLTPIKSSPPKPTRTLGAHCCLPKANSGLKKSLKKSSEN